VTKHQNYCQLAFFTITLASLYLIYGETDLKIHNVLWDFHLLFKRSCSNFYEIVSHMADNQLKYEQIERPKLHHLLCSKMIEDD